MAPAHTIATSDHPVGVFDSGLGGLSVVREIQRRLPCEDLIYFADNAWCPYGIRSPEEVRQRSEYVVGTLINAGAKAIVVACNTASAMAIFHLREAFPDVPLIGLEPAVKPAVECTVTGTIGVLATPRTVAGERLQWLIETYAGGVEVYRVAATGLVELVEAGVLAGDEVDAALRPLLDPMIAVGVDIVVLGCTHYPFLRGAIERYLGSGVEVLDSGEAIARRLDVVLGQRRLRSLAIAPGTTRFTTSGDPATVGPVATLLLGHPVTVVASESEPVAVEEPSFDAVGHLAPAHDLADLPNP
ncbi:MAG TPA: glutamate racemase [Thermomicrobiales bacterium]|nr:glutamate racemase [Thermomicrobiales bacterium]